MRQTRWGQMATLSCVLLLAGSVMAKAMMIAPPALPQRVATADSIVIGKVISIDEKTVRAPQFPGAKEKVEYKVAVVKVEEGFGAAKKLTHVRVGFIPPPAVVPGPTPGPGPGVIIRPIRRYPTVQLAKDQEVCLFLKPHHDASFQICPAYYDALIKNKDAAEQFAKDTAEVKRCVKLLADPMAGMSSKNGDDRFLTAAMLLTRYRTPQGNTPNPKQVEIAAAQSKQILETLANADWAPPPPRPGTFVGLQMTPQNVFYRLQLTDKDGWVQPKDFKQFPETAQKWLKEHAGTYRIKRFVAEEKSEAKPEK